VHPEKISGDETLAIKGKFIVTHRAICGTCGELKSIRAKSADSTAEIRTELICTTDGCSNVLERRTKKVRQTNGNASNRRPIKLFELSNGDVVELEDYECDELVVAEFCRAFTDVLDQIPRKAVNKIMSHWQSGNGSPHVWILKDRKEWRGNGWAATSRNGLSLYFVSLVVQELCFEDLKTLIAHELGHTLFIALNEPNHVPSDEIGEAIAGFGQKRDQKRSLRCEWLVWQLMDGWGFAQTSLEVHMERYFIDNGNEVRLKDTPDEHADEKVRNKKSEIEREFQGITFADQYLQFLSRDSQGDDK
jgi:hypothetical protein